LHTATLIIGGLVVLAALAGFIRTLARTPDKSGANQGYGTIPGETSNPDQGGMHHS
jgi:hypothetical protein